VNPRVFFTKTIEEGFSLHPLWVIIKETRTVEPKAPYSRIEVRLEIQSLTKLLKPRLNGIGKFNLTKTLLAENPISSTLLDENVIR
jgi:hypothetical protein